MFILGLCFGSFINMLVYRLEMEGKLLKSVYKSHKYNKNRSFCDYCGRQLKWYENIPVISWLVQKGKSRCCQKKLSILYPIVEITTGLLFLICGIKFSIYNANLILLVFSLMIITLLVFLAVFDLKHMVLPDLAILILYVIALLFWYLVHFNEWNYFISAMWSFVFMAFLYLVTKGKGMGWGDVELSLFMGLFLGWPEIIVAFYVAFVVGALVGLVGILVKKMTGKSKVPFGPFLILGIIIAWFWGEQIINLMI